MRNHRNLWLSRCGKNFTSWQHTKYIGWQINDEPQPSPFNEPWSIYVYENQNPNLMYGLGNMRVETINNHIRMKYYILDEDYLPITEPFNPEIPPVALTRFPQSYIYHLNGTIEGKEYITVKNFSQYDNILSNAQILPLYINSAIACLSEYMSYSAADLDNYMNYIRLTDEVINGVSYCRTAQSMYRINSYEYKVTENSFFNDIFNKPSKVNIGELKYKGYNYNDDFFKIPEIRDNVTTPSNMIMSSNLPNTFTGYNTTVGVEDGTNLTNLIVPMGGSTWSKIGSPDGDLFPEFVYFGQKKQSKPTNTFSTFQQVEKNPYLPLAGGENPYENQVIVFRRSSAGSKGRWFHIVTRYWWNPEALESEV